MFSYTNNYWPLQQSKENKLQPCIVAVQLYDAFFQGLVLGRDYKEKIKYFTYSNDKNVILMLISR